MKKNILIIILTALLLTALAYIIYQNHHHNLETLDLKALSKYKNYDGSYVSIKSFFQENYNISLSLDGKIKVCKEENCNQISNIKDVVEMIKLSIPGTEEQQEYYFLLNNGDVYKYVIGKINSNDLFATKIDDVKNIKKIINFYYKSSPYSDDSTWGIIAITKDNKTIEIASTSL